MRTDVNYQKLCPNCGKPFTAKNGRTVYCCKGCANQARKYEMRRNVLINERQLILEGKKEALRDKDFLSISEAAKLLGVSRPTIYKKIEQGQIKTIRVSARSVRIAREDLEALDSPVPDTQLSSHDAKEYISRDEAIRIYDVSPQWFHKTVSKAGLKAVRYGRESFYPKDRIRDLFYREQYPDVEEWTTSEELAKEYGCTRKHICAQAREAGIPSIRKGSVCLISKTHWYNYKVNVQDLEKHYLTVEQAKKHYHIGQQTFYDKVNEAGLERRRQGVSVYFKISDLDRLFKDKSPKIPAEIKRDYMRSGDALKHYHIGQKRFSEETQAAGVTKVKTEGQYVWYKKSELDKLFKKP